jgi:hypothetical protein
MKQNKLQFEVTENNGGGLTLVVWNDGNGNEFLHAGYEYNPYQLRMDIAALYSDDNCDVTEWEGNDLLSENQPAIPVQQLYDDHDSTKRIAYGVTDCFEVYPHRMGRAGKECLLK